MGKFIRTSKGYINSDFIVRIEIKGEDAHVMFEAAGSESMAEIKGSEEVREMRTLLELPVPRPEGYTGEEVKEYPETTSKSRR